MRGALHWSPLWLIAAAALAWAGERANQSVLIQPPPEPTPGPPPAAITLPCTVVDVTDGDTLTVEIRLPIRIRLLGCWAAELREPGGQPAKEHLRQLAIGKHGTLHVSLSEARRTDDVLTLGRLLARVWIHGDDRDISTRMIADGFATPIKQRVTTQP